MAAHHVLHVREGVHRILKATRGVTATVQAPAGGGGGKSKPAPAGAGHAAVHTPQTAAIRLEGLFCRAFRGRDAVHSLDCPDIVHILWMLRKIPGPGAHALWEVLAPLALQAFVRKNQGGFARRVKRRVYVDKCEAATKLYVSQDLDVVGTAPDSRLRHKGVAKGVGKLLAVGGHDVHTKDDLHNRIIHAPDRVELCFGAIEPYVSGKEYALLLWAVAQAVAAIPGGHGQHAGGHTKTIRTAREPARAPERISDADFRDAIFAWEVQDAAEGEGSGSATLGGARGGARRTRCGAGEGESPYAKLRLPVDTPPGARKRARGREGHARGVAGDALYCSVHGMPPGPHLRLPGDDDAALARGVLSQAGAHAVAMDISDICVMLWAAWVVRAPEDEVAWLFDVAEAWFFEHPPGPETTPSAVRVWLMMVRYAGSPAGAPRLRDENPHPTDDKRAAAGAGASAVSITDRASLWATLRPHIAHPAGAWSTKHYCNALWSAVRGGVQDPVVLSALHAQGVALLRGGGRKGRDKGRAFTAEGAATAMWGAVSLQLAQDGVYQSLMFAMARDVAEKAAARAEAGGTTKRVQEEELVVSTQLWAFTQLSVPVPAMVLQQACDVLVVAGGDFLSRCFAACGVMFDVRGARRGRRFDGDDDDVGAGDGGDVNDRCLTSEQALLDVCTVRLTELQTALSAEQLTRCLVGCAKVQVEAPVSTQHALRSVVVPTVRRGGVPPRVAVRCLWAATVLEVREAELYHAVAQYIVEGAPSATPPALTPIDAIQAFWAFVNAGASVLPELEARLVGAFCDAPQDTNVADIATLLHTYGSLAQAPPPHAMALLYHRADVLRQTMTPDEAGVMLAAFSSLRAHAPDARALMNALQRRAVDGVPTQPESGELLYYVAEASKHRG